MLRTLILEICRRREWITAGQFAGWFSLNKRSPVDRHLDPVVDAGVLELRFPDRLQSPKQGDRARQDPLPTNPGTVPPAAAKAVSPATDFKIVKS